MLSRSSVLCCCGRMFRVALPDITMNMVICCSLLCHTRVTWSRTVHFGTKSRNILWKSVWGVWSYCQFAYKKIPSWVRGVNPNLKASLTFDRVFCIFQSESTVSLARCEHRKGRPRGVEVVNSGTFCPLQTRCWSPTGKVSLEVLRLLIAVLLSPTKPGVYRPRGIELADSSDL